MKIKSNFSITIIGAGNVATQLSLNLQTKGFKIDCIYNYNIKSAEILGSKLNCYHTNNKKEIPDSSDLYIVALKDDNILNTLNGVNLKNKLIAHTSGSFDSKLLNTHSSNWACFYIMQTILSNFTLNFPPSNANNPSILPPEPVPIVNHLVEDRDYKFTVTATLQEHVNNNWVDALKSDGSSVTQTVVKTFSTGEIQLVNSGSSIQQNN